MDAKSMLSSAKDLMRDSYLMRDSSVKISYWVHKDIQNLTKQMLDRVLDTPLDFTAYK